MRGRFQSSTKHEIQTGVTTDLRYKPLRLMVAAQITIRSVQ